MKKLVEKRNAQFCDAVNESVHEICEAFSPSPTNRNRLLAKTPEGEDSISLLQASGRRFAPVNTAWNSDNTSDPSEVPSPEERPPAAEIIDLIQKQSWYQDQILFRQETEEKEVRQGIGPIINFPQLAPHRRTKEPLEYRCRRPSQMLCLVRGRYPHFIATKQKQSML
jgi:hypothetical protein